MKMVRKYGLFVLLIIITYWMVFRRLSVSNLIDALNGENYLWLLAGICCMGIFVICEGINIGRCLSIFGYKSVGLGRCVKYAACGFFFSSITPSASGGQPMQLYYMHKDSIKAAHGTMALLIELLSFNLATITLAIIGYASQKDLINSSIGNMKIVLILGVGLNVAGAVILTLAIFSEKAIGKMTAVAVRFVGFFNKQKSVALEKVLAEQCLEYHKCRGILIDNKAVFAKTLATSFVQLIMQYSIPFFVYKAMGLEGYSIVRIVLLQAVLTAAVSAIPLPGAVGVSEVGFLSIFKMLFPSTLVGAGMLLSRGISFYLFVVLTGVLLLACKVHAQSKGAIRTKEIYQIQKYQTKCKI